MTGKAIHTKVLGLLTPRERLWAEIRKQPKDFTAERIAHAARMQLDAARDYLRGLMNGGFVEVTAEKIERRNVLFTSGKPMPTKHYRLVRDVGAEAPRVTRDGALVTQGGATQAMWTTLRICNVMDFRILAMNATTPECAVEVEAARHYLKMLFAAGYLEVVTPALGGRFGRLAQYRLKSHMNTGPKAPQVQRTKRVWDPNLAQVVFQEEPQLNEEHREGITTQEVNHAALA